MQTQTKASQNAMTPQKALETLKQGNQRFLEKQQADRDLLEQVKQTAGGQYPFAFVLGCVDSRVSPELVFDQGIGDIFSARVAGNVVNEDILGSMEFACKLAGTKLIVVLGHTKCGAVKGACDSAELGNLTGLVHKIKQAIKAEQTTQDNRSSANTDFVNKVAALNVDIVKKQIAEHSPVLAAMQKKAEIDIVGAMYDVDNGKVAFDNKKV